MSDYNELKALAELACPGPWMQENDDLYFDDDGYTRHMMSTDSGHDVCDDEFCDDAHRDNLKFIAAANPKAVLALIAENESLRKDAERYRWLRVQHWNSSVMAVVFDPKHSVKLGADCPSDLRLDVAIDFARNDSPENHS